MRGRKNAAMSAACLVMAGAGPAAAQVEPRMDGHQVVRVEVSTVQQLRTVLALADDTWTCMGGALGSIDVRMSPEHYAAFKATGIPHRVQVADVQALAELEHARIRDPRHIDADYYDDFKSLAAIDARINGLVATAPHVISSQVIGQSFEGRNIRAVRITGPGTPGTVPVLWFVGTQHAREWISPMTVTYIIEKLVTGYATSGRVADILNRVEFVIVPVSNPDGYEYTWAHVNNRFWRKNRRTPPPGSNCYGVDPNRNWLTGWGGNDGSSADPCSETYRGTAPWSEPETRALRDLGGTIGSRLGAFIDYHSYGQQILWPWSYTVTPPPTAAELNTLGGMLRDAIRGVPGGGVYVQGQGSTSLYIATGASKDWPYATWGAPSWTIELRPSGGGGFAPPPSTIRPTVVENFEAVLQLAEWVIQTKCATAPQGVVASDGTVCGYTRVGWTNQESAAGYTIWRNTTNSTAGAVQIGIDNASPYFDGTGLAGQTYYYFVKSNSTCGVSAFSAGDAGFRISSVSTPTGVVASNGTLCDYVRVAWNPVPGATYRIWRNTTNNPGTAVLVGTDNASPFFDAPPNRAGYHYFVQAVTACGTSALSAGDLGHRAANPTPPTGVAASDGTIPTYVRVAWTAVNGATGHTIWRATVNNPNLAVQVGSKAASPFFDAPPTGATYYYWVRTTTPCGMGGFSVGDSGRRQ